MDYRTAEENTLLHFATSVITYMEPLVAGYCDFSHEKNNFDLYGNRLLCVSLLHICRDYELIIIFLFLFATYAIRRKEILIIALYYGIILN